MLTAVALLLAGAAPATAATDAELARCFWERAPADAETIASTTNQMAFFQALIRAGEACGHGKLTVGIDEIRVAVRDARPVRRGEKI